MATIVSQMACQLTFINMKMRSLLRHCFPFFAGCPGKAFDFKFYFIYFWVSFCEWCGFEAILMGWKSIHEKIHEISRWNKVHPRNTIYTLISSMKSSWFALKSVFALKSSRFHEWNMHKIVVVNFQGGGWMKIHPWNRGC
jgi:hypothetical protein